MIKKILISQPAPVSDKSPYFELSEKYNVDLTFHPFIKVEGITAREFRAQKVQILEHSAIVFNSRHAIDHFFTLCKELRVALPEDMKYFGISETVVHYIQKYVQYRKRKVFFGTTGKWPELIDVMARHKTERYLIPLSDVHSNEVRQMLDARRLQHTECVMYRTVSNDYPKDKPFDFDMLVFFTPAGIASLQKNFPDFEQNDIKLACFGKATAKAITDAGLRVDLEAPTVDAPSMPRALDLYLQNQS